MNLAVHWHFIPSSRVCGFFFWKSVLSKLSLKQKAGSFNANVTTIAFTVKTGKRTLSV